MALYEIAVFGAPTTAQAQALLLGLSEAADAFRLTIGQELSITTSPASFRPSQRTSAVAVFFGHPGGSRDSLQSVIDVRQISVIPVASTATKVQEEIPGELQFLNCCLVDVDGMDRVISTILECLGLLRRQRRVFLSYRRIEARDAALQLFDALSTRGYDVFLDTHSVARGVDFQETLWHRLTDVDTMVMLETTGYFESRWTSEEFGRALAKNIGVLRVQWPDATPSTLTATCSRVELLPEEVAQATGALAPSAIDRICDQLERFRSLSVAVRRLGALSQLNAAVQSTGGQVLGLGPRFVMRVRLANGDDVDIRSVLGVPDSLSLHEALTQANGRPAAVLYDHVGVMPRWNDHLDWLGNNIPGARWIRSCFAAQDIRSWKSP